MLNEKIAVITGASRGIGAAIAKKMAENGATVIINYQGSVQAAQALEAEIREKGGKAVTYKCDVSDFDKCEKFIGDIVKEYGRIDILVNNAGITRDGLLMGMKEEDFDSVINVNLKGTFNTIRFASRAMVKQRKGKLLIFLLYQELREMQDRLIIQHQRQVLLGLQSRQQENWLQGILMLMQLHRALLILI